MIIMEEILLPTKDKNLYESKVFVVIDKLVIQSIAATNEFLSLYDSKIVIIGDKALQMYKCLYKNIDDDDNINSFNYDIKIILKKSITSETIMRKLLINITNTYKRNSSYIKSLYNNSIKDVNNISQNIILLPVTDRLYSETDLFEINDDNTIITIKVFYKYKIESTIESTHINSTTVYFTKIPIVMMKINDPLIETISVRLPIEMFEESLLCVNLRKKFEPDEEQESRHTYTDEIVLFNLYIPCIDVLIMQTLLLIYSSNRLISISNFNKLQKLLKLINNPFDNMNFTIFMTSSMSDIYVIFMTKRIKEYRKIIKEYNEVLLSVAYLPITVYSELILNKLSTFYDTLSLVNIPEYLKNVSVLRPYECGAYEHFILYKEIHNLYTSSIQTMLRSFTECNTCFSIYTTDSSRINIPLIMRKYDKMVEGDINVNYFVRMMDRLFLIVNTHTISQLLLNNVKYNDFFIYSVGQVYTKSPSTNVSSIFKIGESFVYPCYKSSSYRQCSHHSLFIGYDFQPFVFRTQIIINNLRQYDILFSHVDNNQSEVIINYGTKLLVTNISKGYVTLSEKHIVNATIIDCVIDMSYYLEDFVHNISDDRGGHEIDLHIGGAKITRKILGQKLHNDTNPVNTTLLTTKTLTQNNNKEKIKSGKKENIQIKLESKSKSKVVLIEKSKRIIEVERLINEQGFTIIPMDLNINDNNLMTCFNM